MCTARDKELNTMLEVIVEIWKMVSNKLIYTAGRDAQSVSLISSLERLVECIVILSSSL
jgi:hypothetical protein